MSVLRIGETGKEILHILMKTKKKLTVTEIVSRLRRSERSVRGHLGFFSKTGLVRRERSVRRQRRNAYHYFVPRAKDLIESAKRIVFKRLRGLKRYIRS